jgi:hypothetical protein
MLLSSTVVIDFSHYWLVLEAIFEEPQGLPPARSYDHRIHHLPNTAPIAMRPYRYPQLQKDELEWQCEAMLT